jgi:SEC-C motif domain protein
MTTCPCGSEQAYLECCQPLISGARTAQSAEALMRSRYSAYVNGEIDYIYDTLHPLKRESFDRKQSEQWSTQSSWVSLEILSTEKGGPEDETGLVEFVAQFRRDEKLVKHHEVAEFVKQNGRWFFLDGQATKPAQSIRQGPKIGRNDPCTCGSGKKFKKCCGR